MNDRSITIYYLPLDNKVCSPTKTVRSARPCGMGLAFLVRFQAALILWGACCLLTGCHPPIHMVEALNHSPNIALEDLKPESDEAEFALFFSQRKADGIWDKLCLYFAGSQIVNLTLNASILANDQELNKILSQYTFPIQEELRGAIERYMDHRQYLIDAATAFQEFLFTHGLDEVWQRLNQVKENKGRLDLSWILCDLSEEVQNQVLKGLVQFIKHHLPSVTSLNLSDNGLTELPDSFGELINLYKLNLNNNQLTELPPSFRNLIKLEKLYIENNHLVKLLDSFGNLTKLEELFLGCNALTTLPPSFGNLIKLKELNLWTNELAEFPPSFENLIKLEELYLDDNKLTELPPSFGNLTQLKVLHLHNNQLTALPDFLGNLINLEILNLDDNNLDVLPGSCQKLTKLKEFTVENNPLLGSLSQHDSKAIVVTSANFYAHFFPSLTELAASCITHSIKDDNHRQEVKKILPQDCIKCIENPKQYPVILFIRQLGGLTLPRLTPIAVSLSYKDLFDYVLGKREIVIRRSQE